MTLEAMMISIACLSLTVFHPGPAFREACENASVPMFEKRKRASGDGSEEIEVGEVARKR